MEQYECKGGLKNGVWKEFHKLGTVKAEGNYVEGNKEGVFTYYFTNGSIEMKGPFEKDPKEKGEWFFTTEKQLTWIKLPTLMEKYMMQKIKLFLYVLYIY